MIVYQRQLFGFDLLFRFHGSALARALVPAITSTVLMLIFYYAFDLDLSESNDWNVNTDPYPLTTLLVAFTFLLTFRATFSYNRVSTSCLMPSCQSIPRGRFVSALIHLMPFSFFPHIAVLGSCHRRSSNAQSMA